MKVRPGQTFSIGGARLVLVGVDNRGCVEIQEATAEQVPEKTIGDKIDEQIKIAETNLKKQSPERPVLLGIG